MPQPRTYIVIEIGDSPWVHLSFPRFPFIGPVSLTAVLPLMIFGKERAGPVNYDFDAAKEVYEILDEITNRLGYPSSPLE